MKKSSTNSKAYWPEDPTSNTSSILKVNRTRNAMKKIFALTFAVAVISVPIVDIAYAGGANGGGYGKMKSAGVEMLAGGVNGGGYGKVDLDNDMRLAGTGNGGGYGKTDPNSDATLAGTGSSGGYGKTETNDDMRLAGSGNGARK